MNNPSELNLPKKIYVSGNSIVWRGFNGEYYLKIDPKTKRAGYFRDEHIFRIGYGSLSIDLPIRSSKIIKLSGGLNWRLTTNDCSTDDQEYTVEIYLKSGDEKSPVGDWGTILVTTEPTVNPWWRSNGTYVINAFIILSIIMVIRWLLF